MMTRLFALSRALAFLLFLSATASAASLSAYPAMPVDPRAIVVRATGDGVTDDSAALQAAINSAANGGQGGVVFLPSGRYRVTRSILIPLAVRVYGVGRRAPCSCWQRTRPASRRVSRTW